MHQLNQNNFVDGRVFTLISADDLSDPGSFLSFSFFSSLPSLPSFYSLLFLPFLPYFHRWSVRFHSYLIKGVGAVEAVNMHNLRVAAVIGSLTSGVTMPMASVLSAVSTPHLNFASTTTTLSNKALYPFFVRNVPSGMSIIDCY